MSLLFQSLYCIAVKNLQVYLDQIDQIEEHIAKV